MKPLLVIATHNLHKLKEIDKVLGPLPCKPVGLDRFPAYTVRETGKTLEDNALLKARAGVRRTGRACLSDDTGLEVKALKGAPGVYSARYAGSGCTFEDNNRKLLRALRNMPLSKRTAVFRCVVAFADPGGRTRLFEGRCPGRIVLSARGKHGFGYDPVFEPRGAGKTFAELSLKEKNALSHRAKAFKKAAAFLRKAVLALALLSPVLGRAALTGPALATSDYRVDLSQGVALGSTEQVGMGGANIALAHGAAALDQNPAAVAVRAPGAGTGVDWDAALSSFVVGGRDFDNNGSAFTAYKGHVVTRAGGLVQKGAWGFGLLGAVERYDVETAGLVRRYEFGASQLLTGWRSPEGRMVLAGGIRVAEFKMTPKGSSEKLLHLSGAGVSLGVLWLPEGSRLSLGAGYQGPIEDDPSRSLPAGTTRVVDGLVVPRGVTMPASLAMGLAFAGRGDRRPTVAGDLRVIGRVEEADGIESFLEQKEQRSGRRATLSPRLGAQVEAFPGRLRMRAGGYFEPGRFTGVRGRRHGTAGFEWRLFRLPFFGGRSLALGYALDAARRYTAQFISLGFWH